MDMGHDFENWQQAADARARIAPIADPLPQRDENRADGVDRAKTSQTDWAGLRGRFIAIHALRRTLATACPDAVPAGSFVAAAEAVLNACRPTEAVINPVYWANGKAVSLITGPVAGHPTPGDRGMQ